MAQKNNSVQSGSQEANDELQKLLKSAQQMKRDDPTAEDEEFIFEDEALRPMNNSTSKKKKPKAKNRNNSESYNGIGFFLTMLSYAVYIFGTIGSLWIGANLEEPILLITGLASTIITGSILLGLGEIINLVE